MLSRTLATLSCLYVIATVSADAGTMFVHQTSPGPVRDGRSWETAFKTVQQGINAAEPGDEVWVGRAHYEENITLKAGVAVYGGFLGTETARNQRDVRDGLYKLYGGGMNADFARGSIVTVPAGAGPDTILDGAYIYDVAASSVTDGRGGGIFTTYSSPILRNLVITQCRGSNGGGGIMILGGNPTIEDCTISSNRALDGGGIYIQGASPRIKRCRFVGNDGSAYGSSYTVGSGTGGAVYAVDAPDLRIRNCEFYSNRAFKGPALTMRNSTGEVVNCTIVENFYGDARPGDGSGVGKGARIIDSAIVFRNCILMGRQGLSVVSVESTVQQAPTFDHCNVYGDNATAFVGIDSPVGADGNISIGGVFSSINGVARHLSHDSACRDSGANPAVSPDETDLDGYPRIRGTSVDMGAFEYSEEAVRLHFAAPVGNAVVGRPLDPQPVVLATNASGEVVSTYEGWITLAPEGFSEPVVGTVSVACEGGIARFADVSVGAVGSSYAFRATSGTLAPVISNAFHIGIPRAYVKPRSAYPYDPDWTAGVSWETAKRTLNGGISVTGPGGEVWVSAGTLTETTYPVGVALYGGFAGTETDMAQRRWWENVTVLEGRSGISTIEISAHWETPTEAPTVIDGFTFRGAGNAAIEVGRWDGPPVGDVVIAHNVLTGNQIGIRAYSGRLEIRDTIITGSRYQTYERWGIRLDGGATGRIVGNTIIDNHTGVRYAGEVSLANNIIAFNTVGVSREAGEAAFRHNNVFGNATDFAAVASIPTGTDGNIALNPLFANRDARDLHPAPGSPMINAGDASFVSPDSVDVEGKSRALYGGVDIGALEYPARFVFADAMKALRIYAGRTRAMPSDTRLDVVPGVGISLNDVATIARKATGMDANP